MTHCVRVRVVRLIDEELIKSMIHFSRFPCAHSTVRFVDDAFFSVDVASFFDCPLQANANAGVNRCSRVATVVSKEKTECIKV